MALSPAGIYDLAQVVLACVCADLDAVAAAVDGQPGCPSRSCVTPGPPAWDNCDGSCDGTDTCGQLSVHIARTYPSSTFPQEDRTVLGVRGCTPAPTTAAELVVTLLRCVPTLDENGCPPPCEDLDASSRVLYTDMTTLTNALVCCLPNTAGRRGRRFVLGASRVLGPLGGCVGIEQRVTVALAGCAPCPSADESP